MPLYQPDQAQWFSLFYALPAAAAMSTMSGQSMPSALLSGDLPAGICQGKNQEVRSMQRR
jgi:hypothetical protein